jgi:hypothetical protein
MLKSYVKPRNGLFYIYEKGRTYKNRIQSQTNRIFRDWNGDPLIYDTEEAAQQFCDARNEIMRMPDA